MMTSGGFPEPAALPPLPESDFSPPTKSSGNANNEISSIGSPFSMAADDGASNGINILRTLKRRQTVFIFIFALVTTGLALDTIRQRIFSPIYQGNFQLQITNPFETSVTTEVGEQAGKIAGTRAPEYDIPSLIILMRSPLLIQPVARSQGVSPNEIASRLSINPMQDVQEVLQVSLSWADPVKGRAILSELSKEYVKFSLTERQATIDAGVAYLDKQAPQLLKEVDKYTDELKQFRLRNNLLDASGIAAQIQRTRDSLLGQLRGLQMEQVQLQSQIESINAGRLTWTPSGAPTAIEQMGSTNTLTESREGIKPEEIANQETPIATLRQFEEELTIARATFKDDSPVVQSLKAKRDLFIPVLKRQALDNLYSKILQNSLQQDEINRQVLLLNRNFRRAPAKMEEYERLVSRAGLAQQKYDTYIEVREKFRLERARSTTPWQVISPAQFSSIPIEPNIQTSFMRAIMLGLLAGVAAAVIRERTDNVYHTPMETERDLQLPVLGLIPHLPLQPGQEISTSIEKMSASERFAIKESLRSLFTTFRLLRADRNIRLVGVTSSTQGEGKSTSVTVFARTLADLGLNVLIVDTDMRLPMQSRYLGLEHGEGISTLLANPELEPQKLIVSVQENLDILPAGPKPPDPAKLLNSKRCGIVVEKIRALPDYDIVLFDAPPCLMLADPILLGEKLDGILFLVGLGKVSRQIAPQASRRIQATGVDVLGIICNQVNFPSHLNDYGYEYGYYYHYAYSSSYGQSNNRYGKYGRYGPQGSYTGYGTYRKGATQSKQGSYADTYMKAGSRRYIDSYMRQRKERVIVDEKQDKVIEVKSSEDKSGNGHSQSKTNGYGYQHLNKGRFKPLQWLRRTFLKRKNKNR